MKASRREHHGCPEFQAKTSVLCAGGFVDRTNGTAHRSYHPMQSVSPGGLFLAVLVTSVFIHVECFFAKITWCLKSEAFA